MGMTRLDVLMDARAARQKELTLVAVYGGLQEAVNRAGGELAGLTIKLDGFDCLMVLKVDFPAGRMVGFVGASTIDGCFRKGALEVARDNVKWREDKWRANGGNGVEEGEV